MSEVRKINYTTIYQAIAKLLKSEGAEVDYSPKMADRIELWSRMYRNEPPWITKTVKSTNLAASISYETAKLTTLELQSEVKGNDFLNELYQKKVLPKLREFTEYGLAKGGLVIKPIGNEYGIDVQFIQADSFFPLSFDSSGNITRCAFADQYRQGRTVYTLLEIHTLTGNRLEIINRVFKSENDGALGSEVPLSAVPKWAELAQSAAFEPLDRLPIGLFKCPVANQTDTGSPLGSSCFSRAVEHIEEADRRYSNICWEYEATETAVHIAESMLKYDKENDRFNAPQGRDRLYRAVQYSAGAADKPLIETYSPQIRANELFTGWNNQLRLIEFDCSLAYGTLSDPQNVDKTATEIEASKQRSYTFISDVQTALQNALEDFLCGAVFWGQIYGLTSNSDYTAVFEWGDSIKSTPDERRKQDMQDVSIGAMPIWEYRMKWYNEDEATAKAMTAQQNAEVLE